MSLSYCDKTFYTTVGRKDVCNIQSRMQAALFLNKLLDTAIVLTFIVFTVVRPQVFYYRYYTHCFPRPVALARNSLIAYTVGIEPTTGISPRKINSLLPSTTRPHVHILIIVLLNHHEFLCDNSHKL